MPLHVSGTAYTKPLAAVERLPGRSPDAIIELKTGILTGHPQLAFPPLYPWDGSFCCPTIAAVYTLLLTSFLEPLHTAKHTMPPP
jgi:hypothetical protein